MSMDGDILAPSACHLADQGLSRLDLLVFLFAPHFQEGRTELPLPLGPRPITLSSHLQDPSSSPPNPGCPGFFQLRPQAPPVSGKGAFLRHPRPHLLGPALTTAASETTTGLKPQAPLLLGAPQHSLPGPPSCGGPPLRSPHTL